MIYIFFLLNLAPKVCEVYLFHNLLVPIDWTRGERNIDFYMVLDVF